MKGSRPNRARVRRGRFLILARYTLASVPMWPALSINVDWSPAAHKGWMAAAIIGIIASGVFMEASRHARPWYVGGGLFLCALFGMYVNTLVAMKSASHASEDDTKARKTGNLAADTASSQRSRWSQDRDAAAEVVADGRGEAAGAVPLESLKGERTSFINADQKRWNLTNQCDALTPPGKKSEITVGPSGIFCAAVAKFGARIAAAKRRDDMQKLLDAPTDGKVTVKGSEDPFADQFPVFASGFGVEVKRESATAHLNGVRSVWLELCAGFGPMAVLILLDLGAAVRQRLEPAAPPAALGAPAMDRLTPPVNLEPDAAPVLDAKAQRKLLKEQREAEIQRQHDIFVADELEDANGCAMTTGEPWKMWQRFCAARRILPGCQKAFTQRLKANFTHDPNNGRPRFVNVRAKRKTPHLSVVN